MIVKEIFEALDKSPADRDAEFLLAVGSHGYTMIVESHSTSVLRLAVDGTFEPFTIQRFVDFWLDGKITFETKVVFCEHEGETDKDKELKIDQILDEGVWLSV